MDQETPRSPRDEDETRTLAVVSELGSALGISRVKPERIVWRGTSRPNPRRRLSSLGSDQCDFDGGTVILPRALHGKLSPDEWRPLLASQLIYERRLMMGTVLPRWILTVLLPFVLYFISGILLAAMFGGTGLAVFLLLLVPFAVFGSLAFSHQVRTVRLTADRRAADLVGPDKFLTVLNKIDSLQVNDVESRKRGGWNYRVRSHIPLITARIRAVRNKV